MTIINAADKDGDGTLSYDEFVKIMMGWNYYIYWHKKKTYFKS